MQPIIIIDNFFKDSRSLEKFKDITDTYPTEGKWIKSENISTHTNTIFKTVSDYYSMDNVVGYEAWTHKNTRPSGNLADGYHYDKDEYRYNLNKLLRFPVCSIVFYIEIKELIGGRLIIDDIAITPKTDRLIIFGPGQKHYVEKFTGSRYSININPWNRILEEYA